MRHLLSLCFTLIGITISVTANAASGLLCSEQYKTGFALSNWSHDWEVAKFANLKRFIIRPPTVTEADADPQRKWMVAEDGKDFALAECLQDFSSTGVLECNGELQILVNKETARFQAFQKVGYAAGRKGERVTEGSQTPYLSIGSCTAAEVK